MYKMYVSQFAVYFMHTLGWRGLNSLPHVLTQNFTSKCLHSLTKTRIKMKYRYLLNIDRVIYCFRYWITCEIFVLFFSHKWIWIVYYQIFPYAHTYMYMGKYRYIYCIWIHECINVNKIRYRQICVCICMYATEYTEKTYRHICTYLTGTTSKCTGMHTCIWRKSYCMHVYMYARFIQGFSARLSAYFSLEMACDWVHT